MHPTEHATSHAAARTLLAIADDVPGSARGPAGALEAQRAWLGAQGWDLVVVSYADVATELARISGEVHCLLHFPYVFWDGEIEGRIADLYGTGAYGDLLRAHLLATGDLVRRLLPDARFVNPPEAVADARDKRRVKERLLAAGVRTPARHHAVTSDDLARLLSAGRGLYVKAPHGSMGKGITVLAPGRWRTNYRFDGRGLGERSGESWPFAEVDVGTVAFLDALCEQGGFLIEEAVAHGTADRWEYRVTVAAGEVVRVDRCLLPAAVHAVAEGRTWERDVVPADAAIGATACGAAQALDLRYAVLDVVLDRDGLPYVVDVQAFPALETDPDLMCALLSRLLGSLGRTEAAAW